MSLLMPEMPSRPERLYSTVSTSCADMPRPWKRYSTTPGSSAARTRSHAEPIERREPERTVHAAADHSKAHRLAPLPRWATITPPPQRPPARCPAARTQCIRTTGHGNHNAAGRPCAVRPATAPVPQPQAGRDGNLVSKHATCGTPGSRCATESIAPRLWGWCNGANGSSWRNSSRIAGVTDYGTRVVRPAMHDTVADANDAGAGERVRFNHSTSTASAAWPSASVAASPGTPVAGCRPRRLRGHARRRADALDLAAGHGLPGKRADRRIQCEFQAGGARVQHQDDVCRGRTIHGAT